MSILILIVTSVIFIIFFLLYWNASHKAKRLSNVKKLEDRERRQKWTKTANTFKWVSIASLLAVVISGAMSLQGEKSEEITLTHIHGMGYSGDGQRILIPSHFGLKIYTEGKWSDGPGEKHDYMGFTAVDDGFYSSGHPALGSNKKDPLGLVKSTNEGESFDSLGLYGEVDFHYMSAGYESHTIYVFNEYPNSKLKTIGLYFTEDEAKTWEQSEMIGVSGVPTALAVHPTNSAMIAIGTQDALYISNDFGNQFEKLADMQVTSLSFSMEGELFVGSYKQKGILYRMNLQMKQLVEINIPELVEDAVAYIAHNPVDAEELVFATFERDIYLSNDRGTKWRKIAEQGIGR